ncbi:macrophage mannose receptor 1-like, partial [Clarias magur]
MVVRAQLVITRLCVCASRSMGQLFSTVMGSVLHFILLFSAPLIVIKEEKTWREALRFCRQNHVELVSIESEEMQDWVGVVTQNAFSNVTSRVWIGLRHTCALGFWYWVTGETICYQNWAPDGAPYNYWNDGEPNGGNNGNNCVELYPNYTWNDDACAHMKPFVSYK